MWTRIWRCGSRLDLLRGFHYRQGLHADDLAGCVDVDAEGAGGFGEAGHQHHAAGDDDEETCACGEDDIGDVERPAGGGAHPFRVVGEGVLRLRDADGKAGVAPLCEAGELFFGLGRELDRGCAVDLLRDRGDLFKR